MSKPAPAPPAVGDVLKSLGFLELRKEAEGAKSAPVFRITSEVLDRARDRVIGAGAQVENFKKNPVLLWNHESWTPAIGTANVYKDAAGAWLMEPSFDGIGDLSTAIAAKVEAGTLRTCSIRFRPLKYVFNDEGGLDIEEWELLEVSIVNIPCNPEAERLKNDTPQQQKNDPPAPTTAKALDQADIDAIGSVLEAKLAPLMEMLTALQQQVTDMKTMEEEPPATEPEPPPAPDAKAYLNRFFR